MDISGAKELVELLAVRTEAWNTLWDVYKVVAVAIVGIVASGKILKDHQRMASIIAIIGFLVFSIGNFTALDEMRKQRDALVNYVISYVEAQNEKEDTTLFKKKANNEIIMFAKASMPPSRENLRTYHWLLDVFVVLLLFFLPKFQKLPDESSSIEKGG
jgi:hypothetical protein